MMRRGITLVGATTALWILSATAASAHECYNASRSETGNAHAVNGQALVSYDELLGLLCPAGTAIVERAVTANQFATDGHAIDCLPTWFSESIGVAFGTCSSA